MVYHFKPSDGTPITHCQACRVGRKAIQHLVLVELSYSADMCGVQQLDLVELSFIVKIFIQLVYTADMQFVKKISPSL